MHFSLPFAPSKTPVLACIDAGRRALTTVILAQKHVFDFSRLSLLRVDFEISGSDFPSDITVQTEISDSIQREAGKSFIISAKWPNAKVDFEILDRNRGLKASLLHSLHEPERRASPESESKELSIQDLTDDFEPLDWLITELLRHRSQTKGQFLFFGSVEKKMPVKIVKSPEIVEILQSDVLIAQLI
jgi:hypothetical protein